MEPVVYDSEIWVAKNGSDENNGTHQSPFRTIQKAVQFAEPGATIFVRSGEYNETVFINGRQNARLLDLTQEAGLRLVSADGHGRAVIAPLDHPSGDTSRNRSAIEIGSVGNITIEGFEIRANGGAAHDSGGIKYIAGEDRLGNPGGVKIIDNLFTGQGIDAIKITKTQDIVVHNNRFEGDFSQEGIDFLSTRNISISNNEFFGGLLNGVHLKAGTSNVQVKNNWFQFEAPEDRGWAINIGGEVAAFDVTEELPPSMQGFEARDVLVEQNVIVDSGRFGVKFQGAQDSIVRNNFIDSNEEAFRLSASRSTDSFIQSANNVAYDNILVENIGVSTRHKNQTNFTNDVADNRRGELDDVMFDYGRVGATPNAEEEAERAPLTPQSLIVSAGGNGTNDHAPQFEVLVDGVSLGVRSIRNPHESGHFDMRDDTLFQDYMFDFNGNAPERVEIKFADDGFYGGINANIFVDYIELNGLRYTPEEDGVFFADNKNSVLGGQTGKMYVNGSLVFDALSGERVSQEPIIEAVGDFSADEEDVLSFDIVNLAEGNAFPDVDISVVRADGRVVDRGAYTLIDQSNDVMAFVWDTSAGDGGRYIATIFADDGDRVASTQIALEINDEPWATSQNWSTPFADGFDFG